MTPTCAYHDDRPCDELIRDPLAVLDDPDRWPRHVCDDVARASCRAWALDQIERSYAGSPVPDAVVAWADTWPLPVGGVVPGVPPLLLPIGRHMPFPLRAWIILAPALAFTDVTAFGIVDRPPDAPGFVPAAMQLHDAGWNDDRVERFRHAAARWWDGAPATGRSPGPSVSRAEALDRFVDVARDLHRDPTQLELAMRLGCGERSLRSIAGPWPAFKREARAYGEALAAHRRQLPTAEALRSHREDVTRRR